MNTSTIDLEKLGKLISQYSSSLSEIYHFSAQVEQNTAMKKIMGEPIKRALCVACLSILDDAHEAIESFMDECSEPPTPPVVNAKYAVGDLVFFEGNTVTVLELLGEVDGQMMYLIKGKGYRGKVSELGLSSEPEFKAGDRVYALGDDTEGVVQCYRQTTNDYIVDWGGSIGFNAHMGYDLIAIEEAENAIAEPHVYQEGDKVQVVLKADTQDGEDQIVNGKVIGVEKALSYTDAVRVEYEDDGEVFEGLFDPITEILAPTEVEAL